MDKIHFFQFFLYDPPSHTPYETIGKEKQCLIKCFRVLGFARWNVRLTVHQYLGFPYFKVFWEAQCKKHPVWTRPTFWSKSTLGTHLSCFPLFLPSPPPFYTELTIWISTIPPSQGFTGDIVPKDAGYWTLLDGEPWCKFWLAVIIHMAPTILYFAREWKTAPALAVGPTLLVCFC